ncbi:MAG: HPr family phosphocarrier protein [Spirochaetia bacterium]|nr:HPr family phosphocarrier protein [Spirochaetia bacterium]
MVTKEVVIANRAGIHARPAAMIVKVANKFKSDITFTKDDEVVNAKSIMGIITLAATYQTTLTLKAEGPDEQEAVDAISNVFERKFEEE